MLGIEQLFAQETPATDRRRGRRFTLQMKCRVSSPWKNFGELGGVTVDISRSGVLVKIEEGRAAELLKNRSQAVRIVIELPQSPNFPGRCLECMGNIARIVDPDPEHPSVAFEIKRIQVKDLARQASSSAPSLRALPIRGRLQ